MDANNKDDVIKNDNEVNDQTIEKTETNVVKEEQPVQKQENVNNNNTTANQPQKDKKGFSIAALVLGVVAIVLSCVWYISITCAILAIVFGTIGLKSSKKGMSIAGIITGISGIIISIFIIFMIIISGFTQGLIEGITNGIEQNNYSDFDDDHYNYKYDSFYNEFVLGNKRILLDQSAMKGKIETDTEGNQHFVQYFDKNDRVYVGINAEMKEPVKEIDFSLRYQEHIDSINADLNWLSENVGLGSNYYKFDGAGTKTATEVISENSQAFRTKQHYQIIVNACVEDLVKAVCELEGIKTNKITITPDDSIIEDKDKEITRAQMEVSQSLRSKKSYLMDIKGMSEDEAEEELQKIQEEKMSNQEAFGFTDNSNVEEEE